MQGLILHRKLLVSLLLLPMVAEGGPFGQAKVTRAEGSVIRGKSGVQTGPGSKAELDFLDGTVARVGANARFSYTPGTRETKLDNGTLLLSSPKDAGGVTVRAGGIVTNAAGAVDFEVANFGGSVKVISLNGKPMVSLGESRKGLKPGGMLDVPAGATKLPKANVVDLKVLVGSSELLKMGALSSQSKIESNAAKQGVLMPINLPGGANNAVQSAAQTQQIATVERQQQQAATAAQVLAEQAAAQQLARQQFAAQQQQQLALQQEAAKQTAIAAAAEQQRVAEQHAGGQAVQNNPAGQGNNGNQGQGNQGNKPNAPPGQNKPPGGGRPPVVGGGPAPGRPPQVIIPP